MELRQLKYFVKAAETLSFSEAARALNIAQSTLSQQIKQLEEDLGVTLFNRPGHSLTLTEPGEELLPRARKTLCEAQACVSRMQDLGNLLTGTLEIGVTYSFSPILTETIIDFMKLHPGVKLNIHYKPMAELMEMLHDRSVDFVLAFRPLVCDEEIESHVLFDNQLSVIVRDNHTLSGHDKITLAELSRHDLALPTRGLQARNAFDHCVAPHLFPLKVKIELNEVNILLKLIKQSDLVTVLAEATVHNETGVKAIPLDIPSNNMEGCVHMLRDSYHKHSALEFIRILKDSNAVRQRGRDWFR